MAAEPRIRANPEIRRRQILDEAVALIGQYGFHGFSIKTLSQRCQLTNAGLLYYFGTKDNLLIALLEDRDQRDAEIIRASAGLNDKSALTLEKVLLIFSQTVERNSQQPELVRLFSVLRAESLNSHHPAHHYFNDREASVLAMYTQLVSPFVDDPESIARLLLSVMGGLELQWLRNAQGFDLVKEWNCAAALMLEPLVAQNVNARSKL